MEVAVKDRIVLTPNTIWLEKLFLNYLPLTNATFKLMCNILISLSKDND